MARLIGDWDEDNLIDFQFSDGGASEEYVRILMEEFGFPEEMEDENEDAWLDAELDCYGEEG